MAVERFTKEQFETTLFNIYPGFTSLGLDKGEETYLIEVNSNTRLRIRSSVSQDGYAANTGQDSIRLWLEVCQPSNNLEKGFKWRSTSKKVDAYTQRTKGWEKRLERKIRLLWDRAVKFRQPVERCPKCDNAMRAGWSNSEKNPDRPFATCNEKYGGCGLFKWLDKPLGKGDKVEFDSVSIHTEQRKAEQSSSLQRETTLPLQERADKENHQIENDSQEDEHKDNQEVPRRDMQTLPEESQENWLIDDLETLFDDPPPKEEKEPNPKQLEAITSPINANIRVLAPPGSGKTFIIEHRYQHLVEGGINPDNILVVTFNKTMATEMMDRILSTCPQANPQQISTIHAFCFRVLTKWDESSPYYGWQSPGKQSSMKQWEVKKLLDDIISDVWTWGDKPGHKEVLNLIDTAKYHGIKIENSWKWFTERLGARWGEWLYQISCRFDEGMFHRKQMPFSDMLYLMERRLLEDEQFKIDCQEKFPYVMIDEFQDTNAQAIRILLSIARHTFTVGDPDQMLYRFNGAKPEISTSDYAPDIKTILLDKNYRSEENIIQSSQNLIGRNYSDQGGPYPQEFMKDVSGIKDKGKPISFEMYPSVEEEGKSVSETILELIQQGYKEQDFFVGARTKAQLGYLEGELFRAGIKFINIAGGSFWQAKHVADVIAYLRLACDPKDHKALSRVYNIPSADHVYTWDDKAGKFQAGEYCPTRYLGKEFLRKINHDLNRIDNLLFSRDAWRYKTKDRDYNIFGPSKAQDLQEFVWKLQEALNQADNVGQIIRMIIDDCYQKYLQHTEGFSGGDEAENGKLEDLRTVEDIASKYEKPEDFLKHVEEIEKATEDAKNGNWEDYVILSTYHRLKGLERKVVFGTGWCEGIQIKKDGSEEPRGLLPHTFSLVEPPQFGVLPASKQSPVEDERCIAFVCISRAKELVFLSGCETYRNWVLGPSRFIKELEIERN